MEDLNRFLSGWAAYFRYGHSTSRFRQIRFYALRRLAIPLGGRYKHGKRYGYKLVFRLSPNQYGLISLEGIVVAPGAGRFRRGERPNAGGERRR